MTTTRRLVLNHSTLFGCLQDADFRSLIASSVPPQEIERVLERGRQVSLSKVPASCQTGCTLRSVMQPIADALGQAWDNPAWDSSDTRKYFEDRLAYLPEPIVLYYRTGSTTRYLTF